MARINIEECWWSDPRRDYLRRLLGAEIQDQVVVRAWRVAQDFWSKGRQLVPKPLFDTLEGASALLQSGLAEVRGDGVYVRGSSSYLDWINQAKDAGRAGGLKSAAIRKEKYGSSQPEANSNPPSNESKRAEPSLSSSSSFSSSNTKTYLPSEDVEKSLPAIQEEMGTLPEEIQPGVPALKKSRFSENTRQKMRAFIGAYARGYQQKYGGSPEGLKDKAVIGKLGHWIEHVSEVRAINLVEAYLQISYRPFDENYHDLWQFHRHLNRIGVALDTGKDAHSIDWSKVFGGAA